MSKTTNLGLYLTDSNTERFKDWREQINGHDESNMVKIDRAYGELAKRSNQIDTILVASGWAGVEAPFTQTLSIEGVTKDTNGIINVAQDATFDQRGMAREAMLAVAGQADGQLTIAADGEMPDIDIPVSIILLG